jgi:hypothetical protein
MQLIWISTEFVIKNTLMFDPLLGFFGRCPFNFPLADAGRIRRALLLRDDSANAAVGGTNGATPMSAFPHLGRSPH